MKEFWLYIKNQRIWIFVYKTEYYTEQNAINFWLAKKQLNFLVYVVMIDLVAKSGYESHQDKETGLNAVSVTLYTGGGGVNRFRFKSVPFKIDF